MSRILSLDVVLPKQITVAIETVRNKDIPIVSQGHIYRCLSNTLSFGRHPNQLSIAASSIADDRIERLNYITSSYTNGYQSTCFNLFLFTSPLRIIQTDDTRTPVVLIACGSYITVTSLHPFIFDMA
jgi:hypothetical protein